MNRRTRRRSFAELLIESLTSGYIDHSRDRHWVVYEQTTNAIYQVTPPTRSNARRQARNLNDHNLLVIPYLAARQLANAYNHGRHHARRLAERERKHA
ncbi:hypothetical protein [Curtobacterium oceanosedimentum]|uniref:hypothetical protein n=1 Tax=Curtobacterium oceanosedimentum TaxID=465820 RepID=UPI00339502C7